MLVSILHFGTSNAPPILKCMVDATLRPTYPQTFGYLCLQKITRTNPHTHKHFPLHLPSLYARFDIAFRDFECSPHTKMYGGRDFATNISPNLRLPVPP